MKPANEIKTVTEMQILNYHLMHPGEDSGPGDPNAAFFLDGTYHLHYILRHTQERSFAFVHVTSTDMLHWTWQSTKLQPSFTGHGMFSGTGLITKDGRPAAVYHGQGSGRNQIAIAKDNNLSAWEKPYSIEPKTADGKEPEMHHWDPDCFIIDNTYYAISGGQNPPLMKSDDLKNWTYVGEFLKYDLPDTAIGEDISCPNFYPIGNKWMLLCISHPFGCRYYLGDWDADAEQFVPETHGRMNWRRSEQSHNSYNDFFAPESVLTPDGRRVMWAWLANYKEIDPAIGRKTIQSLPRELSLAENGGLRIKPLRELESLRYDEVVLNDVEVTLPSNDPKQAKAADENITELNGDAFEIRITVDRKEALRKRFGVRFFADENHPGLPVVIHPETGTLRVGTCEAPFSVGDLAEDENLELRIFIDKYLVEVFAGDRQAIVFPYMEHESAKGLIGYTYGGPTTFRKVEIWRLKPTNQGFHEALKSRIWELEDIE